MATHTMQSFPKILKALRENNSNAKEKRGALTYIRSNSKKLGSTNSIKEEQYKEICKLVVDVFTNGSNDTQHEAYETLNVIIRDFTNHTLNLFEAMSQINQRNRLKILKLLEIVEDNAICTLMSESTAKVFLENCMINVLPSKMVWLAPNACVNDLQALSDAENELLSDDQKLQEETINCSITLLQRFYKIARITSDQRIKEFHPLVMDKVIMLAYMGHKRQRGAALKLLQHALATDIASDIRSNFPDIWAKYKIELQTVYCKRMSLLVAACELDWAIQWNVSIHFLGTELHRGAGLINNLLGVEEKAFKSTDTIVRRQAFLSWKLLVDNFALDPQELATVRRIKLLCIPLNAKNSKTELIALTKLEVWWHVIIKLYKDISKFVNPVITQFLNFCFGPLGDTPLLSAKFDVVSSPGKRFFKTKLVAIDALCQLLGAKHENHAVFSPILEERLPYSITNAVFQECCKTIIHSVGEVLLILSQLTDAELNNRYELGKILWIRLMNYVHDSKTENKDLMYSNILLIVTELATYIVEKPMIKNLMLDTILPEACNFSKYTDLDSVLSGLILRLFQPQIIAELQKKHCEAFKCLMWRCVKPKEDADLHSNTIDFIREIVEKLQLALSVKEKNFTAISELWCVTAEILSKYLYYVKQNNRNVTEPNLKCIESILLLPFTCTFPQENTESPEFAKTWEDLYVQFESHMDRISTTKPNEVLLKVANNMQTYLRNNKESRFFIINCCDVLVKNINYKQLLTTDNAPSILQLIVDLILCSVCNMDAADCEFPLKALSAILITVYGHDAGKAIKYLEICRPAIEFMLSSSSKLLMKEIASTWETVVSIFRGLNDSLTFELLNSYKEAITRGLNHWNADIRSQALLILELRTNLSDRLASVLEDIRMCQKVHSVKSTTEKKKDTERSLTGNLLNKASATLSSAEKQSDKNIKKQNPPSPETESQEYVLVKSAFKFNVNRLTEHQKESLKRKRDDIPALYNDLSQSSSQNTENLQEWFDKKNRQDEADKAQVKVDACSMKDISDREANKENKIIDVLTEIPQGQSIITGGSESKVTEHNSPKSTSSVENDAKLKQKASDEIETNANNIVISDNVSGVMVNEDESVGKKPTHDVIQEKIECESREESSENESNQEQLSPSISDCGRLRSHSNSMKTTVVPVKSNEDPDEVDTETSVLPSVQRTLRTKVIQGKNLTHGAPGKNTKDFSKDKLLDESKRGIKRKCDSDGELDGYQRRRRKLMGKSSETSDSDENLKSTQSDKTDGNGQQFLEGNLSQRTKNEISRLRINMVFDSNPLPTRRRSKVQEEVFMKEVAAKKPQVSPETKASKSKTIDKGKFMETFKKGMKTSKREGSRSSAIRRKGKGNTKEIDKNPEFSDTQENFVEETETGLNAEESADEHTTKIDRANRKVDDKVDDKVDEVNERSDEIYTLPKRDSNLLSINDVDTKDNDSTDEKNKQLESQSDSEDIVESSQEPIGTLKLEKLYNEKQCFIKINKMESTYNTRLFEESISETSNDEILPVPEENNFKGDNNEKDATKNDGPSENNNIEIFTNDIKVVKKNTDNNEQPQEDEKHSKCDTEKSTEKVNDAVAPNSLSVLGFSSPKSTCTKRYSKFKSYSTRGRVAHMMGLLSRQDKIDSECTIINLDDEVTLKKGGKLKDVENDSSSVKKDRLGCLKETDKISSPCSSRQEKIFNNMKSPDYTSSPLLKSFSNLKDDTENVTPAKNDKPLSANVTPLNVDDQTENTIDGNGSLLSLTKDELPILEWSSANPPSLNASPSASILKRHHRLSMPEPEPESITPNKRKRVSFADPPVSKEMGYEITGNASPHKANKSASRGFTCRKDSPVPRFKQTRLRLLQTTSEKSSTEEETDVDNISEVDLQCERENELLTKIAEELEYSENTTMDVAEQNLCSNDNDTQEQTGISDYNLCNKVTLHNLSGELEVTDCLSDNQTAEPSLLNKMPSDLVNTSRSAISTDNIEVDNTKDSETEHDLFKIGNPEPKTLPIDNDNMRTNELNDVCDVPISNPPLDPLKFDITNDSVIRALPDQMSNSDTLEDTLDAENLTGFNSTVNSDEIFCGKLIRTSTQAAESLGEEDTLPVTDSVFGSLPLSQESQLSCHLNVEIPCPELLDSCHPIYPSLTSCTEPIDSIVGHLTNSMWTQHLSTYFANRGVQTVGDLAQLSEREINRMAIKGTPKVEFVKNVLKHFAKKVLSTTTEELSEQLTDTLDAVSNMDLSSSVTSINSKNNSDVVQSMLYDQSTAEVSLKDAKNQSPSVLNESPKLSPIKPCTHTTVDEALEVKGLSSPINASSTISVKNEITESGGTKISSCTANLLVVDDFLQKRVMSATNSATKTVKSVGTSCSIYPVIDGPHKSTKSVSVQMALEDLLDEIDVNLVLQSAVRRCSAEKILAQYKNKIKFMPDIHLKKETLQMLGAESKLKYYELALKSVCRSCGINKVLLRLPDIFSGEKEFFVKVLNAYRKKIKPSDCFDVFDHEEVKDTICQKCSSSELAEMLSKKLKEDEQQGIQEPMPEELSLNAMLKRMPMDTVISHTVANDELIPSRVVLDIAMQNNSLENIAQALKSQSASTAQGVFERLWSPELAAEHINKSVDSKQDLLQIFEVVSSKLSPEDLLNAYYDAMKRKLPVVKVDPQ